MYTIRKSFSFSAGHMLNGLPEQHPCSSRHGHNYEIIVELAREELNNVGFVVDYRQLEPIKKFIDEILDHKWLNDVFPFNPTAENMAKFIFDTFKEVYPSLVAVEVSETPKTTARYSPTV